MTTADNRCRLQAGKEVETVSEIKTKYSCEVSG